jgi:hypothetical protein
MRESVMFSCRPVCLHGSPHGASGDFWAGVSRSWLWTAMNYMTTAEHYSRWRQLCVHAQICVQGSAATAGLLCMLGGVKNFTSFGICHPDKEQLPTNHVGGDIAAAGAYQSNGLGSVHLVEHKVVHVHQLHMCIHSTGLQRASMPTYAAAAPGLGVVPATVHTRCTLHDLVLWLAQHAQTDSCCCSTLLPAGLPTASACSCQPYQMPQHAAMCCLLRSTARCW